ncbi:MAG: hypothetical protein HY527_08010 [Betaproteobacteria bacterium]|nr:hypothetical protein [Betaproteobacteria bacterium]
MKLAFLFVLCGVLTASGAQAQSKWPSDVATFIERRDGCDHFRGEDAYDEERRNFLQRETLRLCVGTDQEFAALKKKYRGEKTIMDRLNEYEADVEAASKK